MSLTDTIKNKFIKKIASDFVLSAVALVVFNGVVQFLVYPQFDKKLGADGYGDVLFYISVISIMASTFGTAANYSRMVRSTTGADRNADYNRFLLIAAGICIPVVIGIGIYTNLSVFYILGFFLAMILTILRFYADCEFKLNINYRGFLLYYLVAALGYVIGILIFRFTSNWTIPLIMGELFALLFVLFFGKIFRSPVLKKSEFYADSMKSMWILTGANIIPAIVLNADRILLKSMYGGEAATQYYIACLVGKTISFVTTPLNGVMIGYLAKWNGRFTKKMWNLSSLALFVVAILATAACFVGSWVYVRLIYPDYLDEIKKYFLVANCGQIFYFIGNSLMVILLRFAEEKYQTLINTLYAVIFVVAVPILTKFFGIYGFAYSLLGVNFIKFCLVIAVGLIKIGKNESVQLKSEDEI